MNDLTDQQLLRDYAEHQSEVAFAELVRRHIDLVHSAALRMVCDPHLAKDVTQAAFVALAQNARQLMERPVLSGWLHRTAQNLASKTVRTDVRRRAREQEAAAMNKLLAAESDLSRRRGTEADAWEHLAPHLDAALGTLSEPDRDALLLRYFERKSAREMAQTLGTSEAAAQKRVNRAVERLRECFAKRGVTVGAGGLVAVMSANAVQAAPVGLAVATAAVAALAGTMLAATATTTATKAIAMTTLQKTLVTATLAVMAGAGIYEVRQASSLRSQVQTLQQQQAPLVAQLTRLQSDNEQLSNQLARATHSPYLSSERLRELLRLRGEVGVLRQQKRELEQAAAAALRKTPAQAGQLASGVTGQPSKPSPFQVQLVLEEPGENSESTTNIAGASLGETLYLQKSPLLDHTAIRAATVEKNKSSGAPEISVEFSPEGSELFAAITRENLNKRLAIVLDGQVYSAPVIRSEISGGKAQITGTFTEQEAKELAAKINDSTGGQ